MNTSLARLALGFLVLGASSVLAGVAVVVVGLGGGLAALAHGTAGGGAAIVTIAIVAGAVVAAGGIPQLAVWYGVARRRPWARTLGIVMATAMLPAFPIGT